MTIPNRPTTEMPLLLELERCGGSVQKPADFPAFYERIGKHFPEITPEDKKLRRQTGEQPYVWHHSVEFVRDDLHRKGEINGGRRGVWEITQAGKDRLRRDLANLGITNVEGFIRSDRSVLNEVGNRWRPEPLRLRTRVSRRVREPLTEQPITPEVEALPEPSPPPRPDLHQRLLERLQFVTPYPCRRME